MPGKQLALLRDSRPKFAGQTSGLLSHYAAHRTQFPRTFRSEQGKNPAINFLRRLGPEGKYSVFDNYQVFKELELVP